MTRNITCPELACWWAYWTRRSPSTYHWDRAASSFGLM